MTSAIQSHRRAGLALIVLTAGGCVAPLASPSASPLASATVLPSASLLASATVPPLASATVPPPVRLQYVNEGGTTMTFTIDIHDQSGLLVEATDGEAFSTEDPGAEDLPVLGPHYVVFLNDASDESVLRVVWAAGGGCAASYAMTIDPTARKLRIEGPPAPTSGDSVGGSCGVTLRFSEPVPAEEVEGVLEPG